MKFQTNACIRTLRVERRGRQGRNGWEKTQIGSKHYYARRLGHELIPSWPDDVADEAVTIERDN